MSACRILQRLYCWRWHASMCGTTMAGCCYPCAYMGQRGGKSMDMLTNAKLELLEGSFIFETIMGHRSNKASWYAVTWRALYKRTGYDAGTVKGFKRVAYQKGAPVIAVPPSPSSGQEKNATLSPPHGHHLENHLSCFFAASACRALSAKPPAANSAPDDLDVVQRWVAGGNSSSC
jgi:hypothetical protein